MPGYILRTATYWRFDLGTQVGLCRHQFCSYLKWRQASQKAEWSHSEINCLWKGQWYLQPWEPHQMDGLEMVIKPNLCGRSKQSWQWRHSRSPSGHSGVLCQTQYGLYYISFRWLSCSQETIFLPYVARMLSIHPCIFRIYQRHWHVMV